jgi:myo-inositol-1(or 4)-monophosphatase
MEPVGKKESHYGLSMVYNAALLTELTELATRLAKEAGAFLLDGVSRPREQITTKSSGTDMVSEMDKGAEDLLVRGVRGARPHDGILGEEGTSTEGTSGVKWVIDPLDGTTNYLYGHPQWSVSVGVEIDGVPVVGVVEAPTLRETFVGCSGRGATRNGEPIRASNCSDPALALVASGFGYSSVRRAWQGGVVANIAAQVRDIRRGGSAALDLAYVACGRLDAYYETGLNPWDMSAGIVLVREAGGIVTDRAGTGEPTPAMCIAAGFSLHASLRSLLDSSHPSEPLI